MKSEHDETKTRNCYTKVIKVWFHFTVKPFKFDCLTNANSKVKKFYGYNFLTRSKADEVFDGCWYLK